jgi:membrane fusion protein (multidrug efflux system)
MYINFSLSEAQKIAYQNAISSGKVLAPKNGKYEVELQLADGTTLMRKGTIDFVSPVFDPTTGTASYRATVQNGDGKLVPGQFVKVTIRGLEWNNVLTLPQSCSYHWRAQVYQH